MTRRRRLPLALGVCIGTFLLLFSVVGAHALKEPPTAHERQHPSDAEASERNRTLLGKISDEHVPPGNAEGSVERSNEGGQDRVKNSKTEDEEKVPTSLDKDHKVQGIRSRDDAERSSTSDSSGGTRYDEILYGTSGKSSSTKAVSEDFYRLSRTNGLTTVTTKPAFEEARLEEKRNRTAANSSHLVDNNSSHGETNGTERLDAAGKGRRESDEKNQPSSGEGSSERVESKRKYSDSLKVEEEESTTRGELAKEEEEETAMSKNSEVSDLKGEDGDSISLINDTYVNYSHYYKTSTDKNLEGSQSRAPENGTNFISEDRGVSHEWQDPKEEVEVVRNVTHAPIERFVDGIRNSGQLQNTSTNDAFNNELHDRGTNLSNENTTKDVNEKESELKEESARKSLKLLEVTTTRIEEGNDQQTPQTSSSPVPRGRTIAFSGINEFPGLEAKASSSKEDPSVSKKNISSEKAVEQKPYPYLKSTIEPLAIHDTSERPKEEDTTEETSAFENTIGKVQSGVKFVITEPSVVIENSIQQFKPTDRDKSVNESSSNSTSKPSSPMTTVAPIVSKEVKPTDESQVDQSYDLETKVAGKTDEKSESTGNDVPRGNEGSEVITVKENFDVTGNGITEVSSRGESNADKRTTERTYELSFQAEIANGTTVAPALTESAVKPQTEGKVLSNVDVQTNAEESLLIRSTLNVTELSTEYPLTKENTSDGEKFTTSIANTLNSTVIKVPENVTVLPVIEESSTMSTLESFDKNGTNEIPFGGRITLSPDENSAPTVTSVEYEFVGLSEATVVPSTNTTEAPEEHHEGNVTTSTIAASTVQDLDFKNSSEEGTTLSSEAVADFTTTGETEVTIENGPFTTVVTDQTVFSMTTNIRDFTTVSTIEEETQGTTKDDEVLRTTSTVESWSTVSDTDVITVTTTDVPFGLPGSKDSEFSPNVTESSMDDVMIMNITGSITKGTTLSPTVTDNLGPRIVVPSSQSTPSTAEISTERTTDVTLMSLSPDEITSLVRIVMKGSWHDVCPHMGNLRLALAEILRSGMNKSVYAKQIMFHQNPCLEPLSPTPTPTDVPLTSILVYVVDENGKFDGSMTSILPSLYNDSRVSFPVTIHSFLLVQETDSGNAIAVIVVSSVAFICLILLAGLLFIMRKRQTRFNYGERCRPVSLDAYSLDSVSAYNSVRRKDVARSSKRSYGNPTFEDSSAIPSHPLNFAGLSSFCNDVNAINEEFTGIPQVSAKIDELPAGAEVKNRYANVIPLPETRVPLQKMNNDPLTEYINASYVRGPKNATRYYIACQGPMETTVTDLWRMVWEQQCKVIIMLTDLVENGVEKCTEYIPPSEVTDCHRLYGDFQVTLKKRETKEKYAISTLHLKNLENNTFREVYHIWYLWPVNGVQSDGAGLIAVLLEARALQRGGPGPIVVHCSPGTGRTGTLIALDLGIRQYEITRTVDVPRVVYTIRRDRAGAVQTKEQYAFIYKALNLYATKLAGGVLEST